MVRRALARLAIWQRLAVLVVVLMIPLIFATSFMIRANDYAIGFGRKELLGARYLRVAGPLLADLAAYRSALRAASNTTELQPQLKAVEDGLRDLAKLDSEIGDELQTDPASRAAAGYGGASAADLEVAWHRTRGPNGVDLVGIAATDATIEGVRDLLAHVGDTSNLVLDPDLDSSYVIDATLRQAPDLAQRVNDMRGTVSSLLAEEELTAEQRAMVAAELVLLQARSAEMSVDLGTAYRATDDFNQDASLEFDLAPLHATLQESISTLRTTVETGIVTADEPSLSLEVLETQVGAAADANTALMRSMLDHTEIMLRSRVDRFESARNIQLAIVAALLLAAMALTWAIVRSITKPLDVLRERMVEIVEGDGDLTVRLAEERNEIGEVAAAFNRFVQRMEVALSALAPVITSLTSSSKDLSSTSLQLGTLAQETSSQAENASASASKVSMSVQDAASSTEEMSASIRDIANAANEAARVASEAVLATLSTNDAVAKLDASSSRIGEVSAAISKIAGQTNLLALNATIEAARAGEAGKGFAVVASEVKELAGTTADATQDIERQIRSIRTDVQGAADALRAIVDIITRISEIQEGIAAAVEEQTVTTGEIARNVAAAASNTGDIAGNVTSVARSAKDTSSAASSTWSSSQELSQLADDLSSQIARFKVRSGDSPSQQPPGRDVEPPQGNGSRVPAALDELSDASASDKTGAGDRT